MKPNSSQKKKIYSLLKDIVTLRDGEECLRCKKRDRLQLSHIYPKGRYRLMEFMPENLKLLCVGCHLYWWHKNPMEASEWLKTVIPKDRLQRLRVASNTYLGSFDPKLQIIYLSDELKKLKEL